MKRTVLIAAGLFAVAIGGPALAVSVGGKLYVKAKNTKVMANPSATADVVLVLQPGEEVVWQGADAKEKKWHKIEVGGKKGVVFQSNLAPNKPSMEVVAGAGGKEVDPQAFASTGAATKALGDGAVEYGKKKNMGEAVNELLVLEAIAKQVSDADIAGHAKKAGIFPVVGDKK